MVLNDSTLLSNYFTAIVKGYKRVCKEIKRVESV